MKLPRTKEGIVYDSWSDGSDVYKDKKGYYIIQWDAIKEKGYRNYLPKSWKPTPIEFTTSTKKRKTKRTSKKRKTLKKK